MAARRKPATKPAEKQDGDAVSSKANILPVPLPGPQLGILPPVYSQPFANQPEIFPVQVEYFKSAIEAFKADSAAKVRAQDAETDRKNAETEEIRRETQRKDALAKAALPSSTHKTNMEKQVEMDRIWTRRLVILGVCTSIIGSIFLTFDKTGQLGMGMMIGGTGTAVIHPLWKRISGWISKSK